MELIDKQKIKVALEQRLEQYKNKGGFFTGRVGQSASAIDYYYLECKEILDLVDSMPEEPVSEELVLEDDWGHPYVNIDKEYHYCDKVEFVIIKKE